MDSNKTAKCTYGNNTTRNACGLALAMLANVIIGFSVVGLFDGEVNNPTQKVAATAAGKATTNAVQNV